MTKSLSILAATVLSMSTFNALAHNNPQALCYPLAHGEDGMGSKNAVYATFLATSGAWSSQFFMTNVSNKRVNVKTILKTFSGGVYTPSQFSFMGAFNTGNSPLEHTTGGGILQPGETGGVIVTENNPSENFTGEISWQADACLPHALAGAQRVYYVDPSRIDQGLVLFNGGNPF